MSLFLFFPDHSALFFPSPPNPGYDAEEDYLIDATMRLMVSDAAIERALRRFQAKKRLMAQVS